MPTKRRPAQAKPRKNGPAKNLAELLEHAERHGIQPVADPETMRGKFWPAEESVDDFVAAIRALRDQGR